MMRVPSRPLLGLLALLRSGVVVFTLGLIGVAIVAYLPQYAVLGEFLMGLGGAAGFIVFCGVVADGIVHEHERVDEQERRHGEKLDLEIERQRQTLPQALAAAIIATDDDEQDAEKAEAVRRWFRAGDRLGFGVRDLTPDIVSGPDWARLQSFYCSDAGWGILTWAGGQRVTEWGEGWNLPTVLAEIDAERLPLPDGDPPTVHLPVFNTTKTAQKRNREGQGSASEVVIDQ